LLIFDRAIELGVLGERHVRYLLAPKLGPDHEVRAFDPRLPGRLLPVGVGLGSGVGFASDPIFSRAEDQNARSMNAMNDEVGASWTPEEVRRATSPLRKRGKRIGKSAKGRHAY